MSNVSQHPLSTIADFHCLTICNPWAWAIFHAGKNIENRDWETPYRGPLAIHAGKSRGWMKDGTAFLRDEVHVTPPDDMPFGAIVGVVDLFDVVSVSSRRAGVRGNAWAGGKFCWLLRNPRLLREPIPYSGKLGLYRIREAAIVERLLRAAG